MNLIDFTVESSLKTKQPVRRLPHYQQVQLSVVLAKDVLPIFEEKYPDDNRPKKAIEAVEAWLADPSEENATKAKRLVILLEGLGRLGLLSIPIGMPLKGLLGVRLRLLLKLLLGLLLKSPMALMLLGAPTLLGLPAIALGLGFSRLFQISGVLLRC